MNKIKNVFSFILFTIVCTTSSAQLVKFRKVIGNNGYDVGMSAQQTVDKGYSVGGSTTSFGNGIADFYLVKTDFLGVPLWHETYGGINIDKATCVKQTTDKGYILAGYTNSYGAGGYDVYLVKTDSFGVVQWTHTYGGSDWEFANCVEQTLDGGYIICGGTYSYGKGNEDYYLIKTNSAGDTLWTKTYGGTNEDVAKSVIQSSDGGYILTGCTKSMGDVNGDFYTVKTNAIGDTLWTNKFGGSLLDYGNDVLENAVGGYTVGGETKSFGSGNSDGILIYIDALGVRDLGVLTIGNTANDNIQSITERSDGKIVMAGITDSWGLGKGDIYFFIANADWSFYNSTTFGSAETETANSVENTADKGAIICGTTNGFNKLDDIYLIKTDSSGLSNVGESVFITNVQTINNKNNFEWNVYPNPSNSITNLTITSTTRNISVSVYNIIGELLNKEEFRNTSTNFSMPINTSSLANGIYLLKIETEHSVYTEKIIVKH